MTGGSNRNGKAGLQAVDNALHNWKQCLPEDLRFEPHMASVLTEPYPSPNIITSNATFHYLVLLHRPFISDGQLRLITAPEVYWKRCPSAASITSIVLAYRTEARKRHKGIHGSYDIGMRLMSITGSGYVFGLSTHLNFVLHLIFSHSHSMQPRLLV